LADAQRYTDCLIKRAQEIDHALEINSGIIDYRS